MARESGSRNSGTAGRAPAHRVVVVGQAARDLVLRVGGLPEAGGSSSVAERLEQLGGKGANIAVGIRQLNPRAAVALVSVLGDDAAGEMALDEAISSGLDVRCTSRRGRTALLVDVVGTTGERRLLEDVPRSSLATMADLDAARGLLEAADVVVLQLQQPAETLLAAARTARANGARLVLDGAVEGEARGELLPLATVVRADAREASLLSGVPIGSRDDALRAAHQLLAEGPSLVALSVPDEGDLVLWESGHRFFPHGDAPVVDPTGAGDAFVAGLVTGLLHELSPEETGHVAAVAASSTVGVLGGRPQLRAFEQEGAR